MSTGSHVIPSGSTFESHGSPRSCPSWLVRRPGFVGLTLCGGWSLTRESCVARLGMIGKSCETVTTEVRGACVLETKRLSRRCPGGARRGRRGCSVRTRVRPQWSAPPHPPCRSLSLRVRPRGRASDWSGSAVWYPRWCRRHVRQRTGARWSGATTRSLARCPGARSAWRGLALGIRIRPPRAGVSPDEIHARRGRLGSPW